MKITHKSITASERTERDTMLQKAINIQNRHWKDGAKPDTRSEEYKKFKKDCDYRGVDAESIWNEAYNVRKDLRKAEASKSMNRRKAINAAESYGWEVDSSEAWEAYEFACDYFGKENLDDQIVSGLSTDELAESLVYIFRMNDFREWDERNEEDEDEDIEESTKVRGKKSVKANRKNRVMAANNGNASVSKIKKFIEDSVNDLLTTDYTNCRLVLDDDLCLYVGYASGFDTEDGYAICAKIAERNDADWADFDYLNMPWNSYSDNDGSTGVFEGDVYDTDIEITPGEDYTQDAQWLADSYVEIRNLLDEGKLTF